MEELDVTPVARAALETLHSLRARLTLNQLVDTLKGARNKLVTQKGFDRLASHGEI